MSVVTLKTEARVARPLHVLAPLIQKELDAAKDAAERAAEPYHERVADLMYEARESASSFAEFISWAHRNFKVKETQAKTYLSLGKARGNYGGHAAPGFSSLRDYERHLGRESRIERSEQTTKREWHEPVKETIERTKRDVERVRDESLNCAQEREEQRKLALRLIDIGYKILSKELHPDKGGSREVMTRLNQVRDRLKLNA